MRADPSGESDVDYAAIALKYCRDVRQGKIVAGHWVKLACWRHEKDLRQAKKKGYAYYFDDFEAWNVCDFIEKLPHVEGEWDTETITLEPWQIFILVSVFGWRRKSDGHRRFNTVYIEVARKNAKSTLTSAVALYCFLCEGEPGPQIKCAATTGDQARIIFDVAVKMVEKTPDLVEEFDVECFKNSIVCYENDGNFRPINAKASTQDGLNPHFTAIDELHAHKSRALFDVLKSARGARKNPLSWYITTAGKNLECVCYEQHSLVRKILEGVIQADHYFGIIYALDEAANDNEESDDPFDPAVWIKANPNLNVSVQIEELEGYALEAQESPDSANEFQTKRLNKWLGSGAAWLSIPKWDKCADSNLSIDDFVGEPCWMGVDLASKDDIAAVALVFERDNVFYLFCFYYLPEELVEAAAKTTNEQYLRWKTLDNFILTPGDIIDYDYIEEDIVAHSERFDIQSIAFDSYQSNQIATSLGNPTADRPALPTVLFGNTVKNMSDPAKELEARHKVKRIRHTGDPVLRWMASNATVYRDEKENILPKKETKNSPNKIDGIVAIVMAIGRMILAEVGEEDVDEMIKERAGFAR